MHFIIIDGLIYRYEQYYILNHNTPNQPHLSCIHLIQNHRTAFDIGTVTTVMIFLILSSPENRNKVFSFLSVMNSRNFSRDPSASFIISPRNRLVSLHGDN